MGWMMTDPKKLNSFFSFFGSKNGASHRYPPPEHDTIIEPFAGAAGYSCRYWNRNIILVEKDPVVFGVWDWLINVAESGDIEKLPVEFEHIDELAGLYDQRAIDLIGFGLAAGRPAPAKKRSPYFSKEVALRNSSAWGAKKRALLVEQSKKIKHWKVIHGDYSNAPDIEATWFIDPPYQTAGKKYKYGNTLDYEALGGWCKTRQGTAFVCEAQDAHWLPFKPHGEWGCLHSRGPAKTKEAIWINRT